jgi:ribosomal protein L40E
VRSRKIARSSRLALPLRVSMIVSTGWPAWSAANAKRRLSGAQSPAEAMNCRLSKCGSLVVSTSLRVIRPEATSATYMSIEKSDFSDRNDARSSG